MSISIFHPFFPCIENRAVQAWACAFSVERGKRVAWEDHEIPSFASHESALLAKGIGRENRLAEVGRVICSDAEGLSVSAFQVNGANPEDFYRRPIGSSKTGVGYGLVVTEVCSYTFDISFHSFIHIATDYMYA